MTCRIDTFGEDHRDPTTAQILLLRPMSRWRSGVH